jgi:drug/metabolite transporter (DMT)-like permease
MSDSEKNSGAQAGHTMKAASAASIIISFACVYFFWGSTYTAISIGGEDLPPFLMGGVRFLLSGGILLAWCWWRGLKLFWPPKMMLVMGIVGVLLLGGGNVGLIYAEQSVPSGLSSLVLAVIPLYVALLEMILPGGEPLPKRGWVGMAIGLVSLAVLLWPSLHTGFSGDTKMLLALAALLGGALCWTVGSVYSRHRRLPVNSFVAASWQMVIAGAVNLSIGTLIGEWPSYHMTHQAAGAIAYLVTGGSLIGYSAYIYLLEHVPVAKVSSYAYVNPVVAVLLGIFILHEHPEPVEFAGMVGILAAVYLLTTAKITAKPRPIEDLEQVPID